MRWPWVKQEPTEAAAAKQDAAASLDEARGRWTAVRQVAGSLRELRERNHFAEQIERIMRGER